MMHRAVVLLVFLCCPVVAFGQASIAAGVAVPAAPSGFTDIYNPGFGMSGSFPLPIRGLIVHPRITAGFDVMQVDEDFLEESGGRLGVDVEGGDLSIIHFGVDVQLLRPVADIRPYVAPFAGYSVVSVEDFSASGIPFQGPESETAFTVGGTVGVAYRLPSALHVFVEGRLLHAFTEGDATTWVPIHAGVAFDLD